MNSNGKSKRKEDATMYNLTDEVKIGRRADGGVNFLLQNDTVSEVFEISQDQWEAGIAYLDAGNPTPAAETVKAHDMTGLDLTEEAPKTVDRTDSDDEEKGSSYTGDIDPMITE